MIAISRKREQNSAYATKRGPYGAPDTGLDHFKETYRRVGVSAYRRNYLARDAYFRDTLTCLTILSQNKTLPAEDADTPIRRNAVTSPPYCASLSIFAASMKSRSVSPPAECVDSTSFTVFHRMSICG